MSSSIPVAPTGTRTTSGTSGGTSSGGGTRKSGGSSGGGGGGTDPYRAAEQRALKRENDAKRKAAQKYLKQASTLNQQANALKLALNSGFKKALDQRLANVGLIAGQQDATLMEGYKERVGSLKGSAEDNEKAESASTFANLANRGRERGNAISEAMAQGAGETDLLRAQGASLRNWSANQGEVNRGFFDTVRSINTSLNDLNVDTKTARLNIATEANADREQLMNAYYSQRSEALTQLGNIFGQQAELYGLANEAVSSKSTQKLLNSAEKQMGGAFKGATAAMSTAYKNPGISASLRNWEGDPEFEARQNMSVFANAQTDIAPKRPEGATLRAWSQ